MREARSDSFVMPPTIFIFTTIIAGFVCLVRRGVAEPILQLEVDVGRLYDLAFLHQVVPHEFGEVGIQGVLDREPVGPEQAILVGDVDLHE